MSQHNGTLPTVPTVDTGANLIEISMLGSFTLSAGGKAVGDGENRAYQLWRVLEYLLAFRYRSISQEELIEALWPGEESENPSNALKNLVYRIRVLLRDAGIPQVKEMMIYNQGSYRWNNSLPTRVDCEEFEAYIKAADDTRLPEEERVESYLRALGLYKGDFLPKSACESWVVPLSTYYHNLYIRSVHQAAQLLRKLGRHGKIVEICQTAARVDQFDEGIHTALIQAFIDQGESQKAIEHYQYVTTLFYNELGVKPSGSLRGIYREIIKNVSHVESDLDVIKEDLAEAMVGAGAFLCEYEVFKDMYRLTARSAARSGEAVFVVLLTLETPNPQTDAKKYLPKGMKLLVDTICTSLRRGDVVARFSPSQYVLMLPTLTFENGQMVAKRIAKRFKRENPSFPLTVAYSLQPIDPVMN